VVLCLSDQVEFQLSLTQPRSQAPPQQNIVAMQVPMDIDSVEAPPVVRPAQSSFVSNRVRSSSLSALNVSSFKYPSARPGTGYVYDPAMMLHTHPTEDHPETPDRISVIFREMRAQGLQGRMSSIMFRPVLRHQAMLVHSEDHWDKVEQLARKL